MPVMISTVLRCCFCFIYEAIDYLTDEEVSTAVLGGKPVAVRFVHHISDMNGLGLNGELCRKGAGDQQPEPCLAGSDTSCFRRRLAVLRGEGLCMAMNIFCKETVLRSCANLQLRRPVTMQINTALIKSLKTNL